MKKQNLSKVFLVVGILTFVSSSMQATRLPDFTAIVPDKNSSSLHKIIAAAFLVHTGKNFWKAVNNKRQGKRAEKMTLGTMSPVSYDQGAMKFGCVESMIKNGKLGFEVNLTEAGATWATYLALNAFLYRK